MSGFRASGFKGSKRVVGVLGLLRAFGVLGAMLGFWDVWQAASHLSAVHEESWNPRSCLEAMKRQGHTAGLPRVSCGWVPPCGWGGRGGHKPRSPKRPGF